MVKNKFELVSKAKGILPKIFKDKLENIDIIVLLAMPGITPGKRVTAKMKAELRNELQMSGFNMLSTETHGILKLPPGEGKTVVSIGAICNLIILHF